MSTNLQFPKGFMWCAAASAPQTKEAALTHRKSLSTWDKWIELESELFDNEMAPETTSDVYHLYKDDVRE